MPVKVSFSTKIMTLSPTRLHVFTYLLSFSFLLPCQPRLPSCFCYPPSVLPLTLCPMSGCLNTLLRELVNEFTLLDNPASTTTSLLRSMCHSDDSTLLGSWLEETDQKDVEEMVGVVCSLC